MKLAPVTIGLDFDDEAKAQLAELKALGEKIEAVTAAAANMLGALRVGCEAITKALGAPAMTVAGLLGTPAKTAPAAAPAPAAGDMDTLILSAVEALGITSVIQLAGMSGHDPALIEATCARLARLHKIVREGDRIMEKV